MGKLLEWLEYQTILPVSWESWLVSEKPDWFKIEQGVWQGCLLSPYLFLYTLVNLYLYTENIMRNAGLDELQAGIQIGRRNINNLRYVDE